VANEVPESDWYPSWGMIGVGLSLLALFVAIMSAKKQAEMAEICVVKPRGK
jgi:hypothetical protein